ncbi:MAG TPA: YccF domain-containing protein [Acidimicrobiia bacterium]
MLRVILNIIWLLFAGIELAVVYVVGGIILCLTVVGVPFGIQLFKLAGFAVWPFGRAVVPAPDSNAAVSAIFNILWLVFVGWWLALLHIVFGLVLCITIIGIPLGIAVLKMTGLALWPFGRTVVFVDDDTRLPPGSYAVGTRLAQPA